jgi:hypothetical protein
MLEKQMKKEYKAKMKELSQGGWQVMGTSHSLEVALLKHYDALTQDDVYELEGVSTSSQKNIGTAKLQQDAIEKYTTQIGMSIKGRVTTQHGSQVSSDAMEEIDSFLQGFDGKVQAELKGELKLSYMIYREAKQPNGKPCYEFEGYFIVDIEEAHQARMKAFQQMLAESRAHQKIAKETAEWINEAFEAEQAELLESAAQ